MKNTGNLFDFIRSDLNRIDGSFSFTSIFKAVLFGEGSKYLFWFRLCQSSHGRPLYLPLFLIARIFLRRAKFRLGISIPFKTQVGAGLYIGHFGGIIVHQNAIIGENCNISHGVTIGQSSRGPYKGWPIIGDRVFIGPGAKIIGNIQIGNDVAIGANAVVVNNIESGTVVAGNPAKVISHKGSAGYVNNISPSMK